jgi:SP family xylose:H+ symportor-like MFS transporter
MKTLNRTYLVWITIAATLGGFLFGYDTAVISGAIKSVKNYFSLNDAQEGWAVANALIGCIIGAIVAGYVSQALGRKLSLMLSAILFFVSALGSATANVFGAFIAFRLIGGIGIGLASMLSPMYIAEVSPAKFRGRMVSLYQMAIVTGIFLVFWVNFIIAKQGDDLWNLNVGWRWMLGSETIPAALFFFMLFLIPESPRWLTIKGKEDKSFKILSKINGEEKARSVLNDIKESLQEEKPNLLYLFKRTALLALIIGIGLSMFQQITGINAIMYYAPKIFEGFGSERDSALYLTVFIGAVNFAFTFLAIFTIDRIGRKPLLMIGIIGMIVSLTIVGFGAYYNISSGWQLPFILLFVASFAMSWGPVVWVMLSEIFSNKIRNYAMSIAVFAQWAFNFLVSQTFPMITGSEYLNEEFNGAFPFWLFAIMSVFALVFVWRLIPETKNKTLEEMEALWQSRIKKKKN